MCMMKRVLLWAGLVLLLFLLCDCGTSSGEAIAWSEEDWATAELPADNRFDYRDVAAAGKRKSPCRGRVQQWLQRIFP